MKILLIFNVIFLSIFTTLAYANSVLENGCYDLIKTGVLSEYVSGHGQTNQQRCREKVSRLTDKTVEGQYNNSDGSTNLFKIAVTDDVVNTDKDKSVTALEMSTSKSKNEVPKYNPNETDYSQKINESLISSKETSLSLVSRKVLGKDEASGGLNDQTSCAGKYNNSTSNIELLCTTINSNICKSIPNQDGLQLEIVKTAFEKAYGKKIIGRQDPDVLANRTLAAGRLEALNDFANKGRSIETPKSFLNQKTAYRELIDKIIKANKNDSEMEAVAKDIVRRCKKYFPPSADSSQKQLNENK